MLIERIIKEETTDTFYLKFKPGTDQEEPHHVIMFNGKDVGYLINVKKSNMTVGQDWEVWLKNNGTSPRIRAVRTRKDAIKFISDTLDAVLKK